MSAIDITQTEPESHENLPLKDSTKNSNPASSKKHSEKKQKSLSQYFPKISIKFKNNINISNDKDHNDITHKSHDDINNEGCASSPIEIDSTSLNSPTSSASSRTSIEDDVSYTPLSADISKRPLISRGPNKGLPRLAPNEKFVNGEIVLKRAYHRKSEINAELEQPKSKTTKIKTKTKAKAKTKAKTKTKTKTKTKMTPSIANKKRKLIMEENEKENEKKKKKKIKEKAKKIPDGPLIGFTIEQYYDTDIENDQDYSQLSKLVEHGSLSEYTSDITTILLFINQFRSLFPNHLNIGPQDIEDGLGFTSLAWQTMIQNSKIDGINSPRVYELRHPPRPPPASNLMEKLFCQLLALILNRKKPVEIKSFGRAVEELSQQALNFGLPNEWKVLIPSIIKTPEGEEQVLSLNEILYGNSSKSGNNLNIGNIQYGKLVSNAVLSQFSFPDLNPPERLVLLRILVQWALSNSELVRAIINEKFMAQDQSLVKDTYYIEKTKLIEETEGENEHKLKQTKFKKQNSNVIINIDSNQEEETQKEIDNIHEHPLSLRHLNYLIGDDGYRYRFYLVTGVEASVFKLYARNEREVVEMSNEVNGELDQKADEWFEVASSAEELEVFVQYLGELLHPGSTIKSESMVPEVTEDKDGDIEMITSSIENCDNTETDTVSQLPKRCIKRLVKLETFLKDAVPEFYEMESRIKRRNVKEQRKRKQIEALKAAESGNGAYVGRTRGKRINYFESFEERNDEGDDYEKEELTENDNENEPSSALGSRRSNRLRNRHLNTDTSRESSRSRSVSSLR